jgi:hypothetical protein
MNSKKRAKMASNKIDVFFCRRASHYCLRNEFARMAWKRSGEQSPVQMKIRQIQ